MLNFGQRTQEPGGEGDEARVSEVDLPEWVRATFEQAAAGDGSVGGSAAKL